MKQNLLQLKIPHTCTELHQMKQHLCRKNTSLIFYEGQAFPHLLPKDKFSYNMFRDIPVSPVRYLIQRLLNFNQHFATNEDYILFARSAYEQHHLCSSLNFDMDKIKPTILTAGTVKSNFEGIIGRLVASDNVFSFTSSAKGDSFYKMY